MEASFSGSGVGDVPRRLSQTRYSSGFKLNNPQQKQQQPRTETAGDEARATLPEPPSLDEEGNEEEGVTKEMREKTREIELL